MAEILSIINNINKLKYARVTFNYEYGETYSFLTILDNLRKDDEIVVHTKSGFKVAYFICYLDKDKRATDWIVQKVDTAGYEQLLKGGYK